MADEVVVAVEEEPAVGIVGPLRLTEVLTLGHVDSVEPLAHVAHPPTDRRHPRRTMAGHHVLQHRRWSPGKFRRGRLRAGCGPGGAGSLRQAGRRESPESDD